MRLLTARFGCDRSTPPSRRRVAATAIAALLLVALAAGANAVMDTLSFRFDRSVFAACTSQRQWLDPRVSWHNKWRDGDPAHGEAFPLSSTALVATTDAWHCAKSLMLACLFLAILLPCSLVLALPWPGWLGIYGGMHLLWGAIFEGLFAGFLLTR